jgi:hypothetical protein
LFTLSPHLKTFFIMADKMRIKSEKTGKEVDISPAGFKKLEAQIGKGKFDVIKENTTPPEATAARQRQASLTAGTAANSAGTAASTTVTNSAADSKDKTKE